jgi:hypothetical protein
MFVLDQDNKLIPTEVMPEQARAEEHWWYDRKYVVAKSTTNTQPLRLAIQIYHQVWLYSHTR